MGYTLDDLREQAVKEAKSTDAILIEKSSSHDDSIAALETNAVIPPQGGNAGKFLQTDGASLSWATDSDPTDDDSGLIPKADFTAANSLLTSSGAATPAELLAGADGTWLKSVGGVPTWSTLPGDPDPPSGPSTTDTFVTTHADIDLTNNTVIPGLAGSPDIKNAGGYSLDEFDVALPNGWSTFGTFVTIDANTTVKSHLYIEQMTSGGGDKIAGIAQVQDAMLTNGHIITCKLDAGNLYADTYRAGMLLSDHLDPTTGGAKMIGFEVLHTSAHWIITVTEYTGGMGAASASINIDTGRPVPLYFRFQNSGGNFDCYASFDGVGFFPILLGEAFLGAPAHIFAGLYGNPNQGGGAKNLVTAFDWIRD